MTDQEASCGLCASLLAHLLRKWSSFQNIAAV